MAARKRLKVGGKAVRRYWREADARAVVEAWRESGLSAAEYARRHGVHARRLRRWAVRLQPRPPASVSFHPVRLVAAAPMAASGDDRIEVVLDHGRRIIVPHGFLAGDLRQVLDVLEARP